MFPEETETMRVYFINGKIYQKLDHLQGQIEEG